MVPGQVVIAKKAKNKHCLMMNWTLERFRDEYLVCPPDLGVLEHREYGKLRADVVWRDGLFQVEKVTMEPNCLVLAHRHPNIDAYEAHVAGDLIFLVGTDVPRLNAALEKLKPFVEHRLRGKSFRVRPTDWHGAKAGPNGAVFFSIQHWTGEVPMTAAGVDWEGPAI